MRDLVVIALALICGVIQAAEPRELRIGIQDKPPYAQKDENGEWQGIAVELWKNIADLAGLKFQWVEVPFDQIVPAVQDGRLDAAVGEIEVSAAREELVHFTQPYLQSSIGVAVSAGGLRLDWFAVARDFFNWSLLIVVGALAAGMLLVSLLIWLLERDHHIGHFKGGLTGFGSALWLAGVTMTGVGYGDKKPSTFAGRLVSFIWIFVGVLLIASFTAAVASSVSIARIDQSITVPSDLVRFTCGVMEGTVSRDVLRKMGLPVRTYDTLEAAVGALGRREIEAVVGDRVSLAYLAGEMSKKNPPVKIRLTPVVLQSAFVAIPVHPDLPEFEQINVALLKTIGSPEWQDVLKRWLGPKGSGEG
jgi:ABC-type amino acid transport substrate-binding protein